ncbi:MAG: sulfatase-like hydrolase/transferase [Gammaproteobacteria bacterium]|nr:sulfatase-like hydrolase/transferase [Gammaproteobacteria bacterium]
MTDCALLDDTYEGPREEPVLDPRTAAVKHVILVVDESVRADYLSINGFPRPTTPYLKTVEGKTLNYGAALAGSGCSAYSHVIMRSGLQPRDVPDTTFLELCAADVFQYAQAAGYRLQYLDGQVSSIRTNNMLTHYDEQHIDWFYQHSDLHRPDTEAAVKFASLREAYAERGDALLARILSESLDRGSHTFSLVVKAGAHFHYEDRYPRDAPRVFAPTLVRDEPLGDRERTVNSYLNALRWTVDGFFAELLPALDGRDYVLIYTSDHG